MDKKNDFHDDIGEKMISIILRKQEKKYLDREVIR